MLHPDNPPLDHPDSSSLPSPLSSPPHPLSLLSHPSSFNLSSPSFRPSPSSPYLSSSSSFSSSSSSSSSSCTYSFHSTSSNATVCLSPSSSLLIPSSDSSNIDSEEEHGKKAKVNEKKYKTEICKNWQCYGRCSYGVKCKFAHGEKEKIKKKEKSTYKSKLCQSFHNEFYCPYGVRCLFIHGGGFKFEKSFFRRSLNGDMSSNRRLSFFKFYQNSDFLNLINSSEAGELKEEQCEEEELFEITKRISAIIE